MNLSFFQLFLKLENGKAILLQPSNGLQKKKRI